MRKDHYVCCKEHLRNYVRKYVHIYVWSNNYLSSKNKKINLFLYKFISQPSLHSARYA